MARIRESEETASNTAAEMTPYRMGSDQVFSSPQQQRLRLSIKDDRRLRSSIASSASCSSFDEEDLCEVDAMCKRFDRIFTTGTSVCSSPTEYHPSHVPGATSAGASTIHPNKTERSSALQIWMDHQYAEELAANEIAGQSDDSRQVCPDVCHSSVRNVGGDASRGSLSSNRKKESTFRHQSLWMATAQLGTNPEPTRKGQDGGKTPVDGESETNRFQQDDEDLVVEVSPGVLIPLMSAQDTWKAIQAGRIMVSTCLVCQEELTSADSVQFVTCSDCWSINAIHQVKRNTAKVEDERTTESHEKKQVLGVGVKNHEIVQWIEDGCR